MKASNDMTPTDKTIGDNHTVSVATINAELVRKLFACCRNLQNKLHSTNSQCCALRTFAKEIADPKVHMCISNIERNTKYAYSEEYNFPNVAKTLTECRQALMECGEWKKFSDYSGFIEEV